MFCENKIHPVNFFVVLVLFPFILEKSLKLTNTLSPAMVKTPLSPLLKTA